VLVAGGSNGSNLNLASAELYDPAAGTWSTTGSLNIGRSSHTATLLTNGKVLVAGGSSGGLASAELYDIRLAAAFSNLSSPIIIYGTTPTTLSGKISAGSSFPTGNVSITLNGVTQQAAIQADGTFSSDFATGTLSASGSPYTITYSYGGDAIFNNATDSSKTLTVNKATATVSLSNLSQTSDGTPKAPTATTTSPGLSVIFTYTQNGTPVTSPSNAGSYTVSATINDANYQGSATGTLVINPAAATAFVVSAPASASAGNFFNITLTARDAFGNTVTGYTGTVHFTSTDAQAVLPANYTFTAGDGGSHIFSVTLRTPGAHTITATDTVNASITGTSGPITVTGAIIQFDQSSYSIAEGTGSLSLIVNRTGDPAVPLTVNYATSDTAVFLQNCNVINGAATSPPHPSTPVLC
jgi:hypothetical protein